MACVVAAANGDFRAVSDLIRAIRPRVASYCRTRLGDTERALGSVDDVVQEVCIAVIGALPTYQDEGPPFMSFVYGIARNKVVDARRSTRRERAEPVDELAGLPSADIGPQQHVLRGELAEQVEQLLWKLPDSQRKIMALRVMHDLSIRETATAIGLSVDAVRVAQQRALKHLRRTLAARTSADCQPIGSGSRETWTSRGSTRPASSA
ncbi:RNA polymerase subunit sigma [Amycolatopsis sp. A1MSW2902]|uniref:RNA polymerase sigma factor ShbA n=1 Tax=Amycolatopsis sp. A1MSW2902 TaxID=687413 RepID=UPI00307FAE9C